MSDGLIKRIEEAREGSRELSDEVLLATGWTVDENPWERYSKLWTSPDRKHSFPEDERPDPTQNLQDTLGLVLEGYDWALEWDGTAEALYWERGVATAKVGDPMLRLESEAATPPLAMTAAWLKAIQEMER